MSMPIDFTGLEFWTYGFVGTIFTGTVGWVYGIIALWWFLLAQLAVHREDPEPLRFDFHLWWVFTTTAGVVSGVLFSWALGLNKLIDTEFINTRNRNRHFNFDFTLMVLWATLLLSGYYCVRGDFSDGFSTWPLADAQLVGIVLLVVGAVGAFLHLLWLFLNMTDRRETSLNAKYILAMGLLLFAAPFTYDFCLTHGVGSGSGGVALGAIAVSWVLIYFWVGYLSVNQGNGSLTGRRALLDTEEPGKYLTDRFHSPQQVIGFVVIGGLSQFLIYLVGWLVDAFYVFRGTTNEDEPVVVAIVATSALLCIVYVFVGMFVEKTWLGPRDLGEYELPPPPGEPVVQSAQAAYPYKLQ